jgi:hypothetical protein
MISEAGRGASSSRSFWKPATRRNNRRITGKFSRHRRRRSFRSQPCYPPGASQTARDLQSGCKGHRFLTKGRHGAALDVLRDILRICDSRSLDLQIKGPEKMRPLWKGQLAGLVTIPVSLYPTHRQRAKISDVAKSDLSQSTTSGSPRRMARRCHGIRL